MSLLCATYQENDTGSTHALHRAARAGFGASMPSRNLGLSLGAGSFEDATLGGFHGHGGTPIAGGFIREKHGKTGSDG